MTFRRPLGVVVCALLLANVAARGGERVTEDLAHVPADALGFVHVRVGDIWRSEAFKDWRDVVLKAGEPVLAAFDQRFFPTPSSVERVTMYVYPPAGPKEREPNLVVVLATSKPIERQAFLAQSFPNAKEEQTGGKTLFEDARARTAIHFHDAQTLVFGPPAAVRAALARGPVRKGPLAEAVDAARTKPLVVGFNPSSLPPPLLQQVPIPFQPILKAVVATFSLDFDQSGRIELNVRYSTEKDAEDAEKAARGGLQLARFALAQARAQLLPKVRGAGKAAKLDDLPEAAAAVVGLGVLARVEELIANPPLTREKNSLQVAVKLPSGGPGVLSVGAIGAGLLLPAVQKVRQAATRTQDANNLKQMALAFHNHADVSRKGFPAAAICDKAGKPLLSWRVAILPFIEQEALYRQFKLDEPWDSPHNHKLLDIMPQLYINPAIPFQPGHTHYRVFVGGGALFDLAKPVRFADITDGTSNTLLIVESADSVPWTKPEELTYDPKKPLPRMAAFFGNGLFNAALADGSVRTIRADLPEVTLRALITRSGGEVVNPND